MSGCDPKAKSEVEIMWTNQHGTGQWYGYSFLLAKRKNILV